MFTNDGLEWERSRKALAPIFHGRTPLPQHEMLETHVIRLVDKIQAPSGGLSIGRCIVDLQPLFRELALRAAIETLLGRQQTASGTQEGFDEDIAEFSEAFSYAVKYLARRERLKAFYWILNGTDFRDACSRTHNALDRILEERANNLDCKEITQEGQKTAAQTITSRFQEPKRTRDEILNLLFAARDTTTSFLNWTLYALAREPQEYSRLRTEILSIVGDDASRIPSATDLAKMTGLDNVLNEGE